MLLCRLLPVYTLDHINTSGTIEKLWESIEFCDKNNVELECLSHLAHHMENANIAFCCHNVYRCTFTIREHMKNRILGYKISRNKEGKQFNNDMNSVLVKIMKELGCFKIR